MQIDLNKNREELFNIFLKKNLKNIIHYQINNFRSLEKLPKTNLNLISKKIYSLSIFGFVIILGLLIFYISQSKKNKSTITIKSILLDKRI